MKNQRTQNLYQLPPMTSGVKFAASVVFDVSELQGWRPDQIKTLMAGIAGVIAVSDSNKALDKAEAG